MTRASKFDANRVSRPLWPRGGEPDAAAQPEQPLGLDTSLSFKNREDFKQSGGSPLTFSTFLTSAFPGTVDQSEREKLGGQARRHATDLTQGGMARLCEA